MSAIDLIILGLLIDKEMSAYELVKYIEERHVNRFLKVSAPAVYKRCKVLASDGYVDCLVKKEGAQPEKTIYIINSRGSGQFYSLMDHFSTSLSPFFLDWSVFIFNLGKLDKQQGLEMLRNLETGLVTLKHWIISHEAEITSLPFSNRAIVKQYRMIIVALNVWIEEVITEYEQI